MPFLLSPRAVYFSAITSKIYISRRPYIVSASSPVAPTKVASLTPRPSASLVVVNKRNEILLVHRNPKASSFGGMHVFPGGNLDKKQDQSLAFTAIRETFEETGLLLASGPQPPDTLLDESNNLQADVASLLPFTQWITPVGPPRRFHTQFYAAFLPAAPSSGFSAGAKQERIPKHDGGQEVIEARFVHPKQALDECREGKIRLMPPQYYILSTLADILQGSVNAPVHREKVEALSRGLFGRMVINPVRLGEDKDGRTILTYEGDETRGGSKGRLHRSLMKGISADISLIRNFDIFNDIESRAFDTQARL